MPERLNHRIKQLIVGTLGLEVAPEEIPDDETFFGDGTEIDSIAALEIIVAVEEEFGITVEDDELTADLFDSVATLEAYVAERLAAEQPRQEQTAANTR